MANSARATQSRNACPESVRFLYKGGKRPVEGQAGVCALEVMGKVLQVEGTAQAKTPGLERDGGWDLG